MRRKMINIILNFIWIVLSTTKEISNVSIFRDKEEVWFKFQGHTYKMKIDVVA
jgi:hypothetical protein